MNNGSIENPFREREEKPKMGKKKYERKLTDEEVVLLNNLVDAGSRILRNKEIGIHHPEFQDYKKDAIKEVFLANNIQSQEKKDRLWPSLATRIELMIAIPPEEHFQKKRLKEIKNSLGQPDDERIRELVNMARERISSPSKKRKADAATIRNAVYQTIALIRYPSAKSKEAEAKVLKYYLAVENGILPSDPALRSVSDPDRQKNIFKAA